MATEPTLALQEAIVAALKADTTLTDLISGRVYDRVPGDPTRPPPTNIFPYVRVGQDQDIEDGADCIEASEIFAQIDVFSRAYGKSEVKSIAGSVRRVLHEADLTLDENALVLIKHENTLYRTDPDGLTEHAILIFRALTEATT